MKIMTWNVNLFNGKNWNLEQNGWKNNDFEKRKKNADNIREKIIGNLEDKNDIVILQEFPNLDKDKELANVFKNKGYDVKSWYDDGTVDYS